MNETKVIETTETATAEIAEQKPYTFRMLGADDMFLMFNIISKIGIREFKTCFQDEALTKVLKEVTSGENKGNIDDAALYAVAGVALLPAIDIILGNVSKCKDDIYALLSNVSGMKVADIKKDALLFTEMLIDFLKKPEFPDFIKVVSKLFK